MSNKTLAIIVNIFLPGIGTLIVNKTTIGIIQVLISVLCVVGTFITLGFGGVIFVPIGFINWIWAIVASAT